MTMRAHKIKIVVTDDHEVNVKLPSDFPAGDAELIVIAEGSREPRLPGDEAAREFSEWLDNVLSRAPRAPVLPPEAFDRSSIYDE